MKPIAKRPYLPELEIARAFGIMAVVMIHATSAAYARYDHQSAIYPLYVFLNIFSKFAVPVFIFLSGFVLFYNYYDKSFTAKTIIAFYKKRISKIVIPFLLFSVFYYGFTKVASYGFSDIQTFIGYFTSKLFLKDLIIGKTYTHLYFVVIIIQFYVIAPFMLYAVKRFPSLGKHIVWIGLLIQWLFIFKLAPELSLKNRGSYCFTYMFYFTAGAFIGIYYIKLVHWINITKQNRTPRKVLAWVILWTLFIAASLTEVYVYYYLQLHKKLLLSGSQLEFIDELRCVLASILLIQLSIWIYSKWSASFVKVLIHLGASSFAIYLMHPALLYLYRRMDFNSKPIIYHASVAGGFVLALLLPWLIAAISSRHKWHWLVFGPLPAKKKPVRANAQKDLNAGA